ncbi:hypothetical protein H6504_04530 [Candidatus Woesearchaeota archaeon]|nr:hypothetical protein [Candidatus Woesearchaeota archaeon]
MILGLLLLIVLFSIICLPGYLVIRLITDVFSKLELVIAVFVIGIINMVIGTFLLTLLHEMTGGINALNLWIYAIIVAVIMELIYLKNEHKDTPNA